MEDEVQSSSSGGSRGSDDGPVIELSGKIMLAAVIMLFCVIVLVLALHLYARWCWIRRARPRPGPQQQQEEEEQHELDVNDGAGGLDASLIRSLPILIFNPDVNDGLECAVCLCDISEGEKARLLPKCNHGFHVDCIDMWFQTHHTCPLCRNSISLALAPPHHHHDPHDDLDDISISTSISIRDDHDSSDSTLLTPPTESPSFPTNVLFWGNQIHVTTRDTTAAAAAAPSTLHDASLLIDIPTTLLSHHNSSPSPSPTPTRLRSLRRLLSRDKRVLHSAYCTTPATTTTTTIHVESGGQTSSKSSSDV
ncbi:hypothetical protein Scep_025089 [Stephania cephalantha]|uniref:RING-type E3 ubiquitin transferase n=1 Tax=Stephania cephalantha TaxID=152367 RepID=A0AAP0EYG9_9MAGN